LCLFNFSELPVQWKIPAHVQVDKELSDSGLVGAQLSFGEVAMPAWTGLFALLK
jgi:hypothetical protein